jgi:general secretion pathway protein E
VTAIVAQRLVRRLCPECKVPYTPTARELSDLGVGRLKTGTQFYKAGGCASCAQIGYMGRLGLYELVMMDDTLRGMIHDGAREIDMSAHAFKRRATLLQSGADHVAAGLTSTDDVLRVCRAKAAEEG